MILPNLLRVLWFVSSVHFNESKIPVDDKNLSIHKLNQGSMVYFIQNWKKESSSLERPLLVKKVPPSSNVS